MNKDFKLFEKEFKRWQRHFGLTGYKVYFKNESTDNSFATISIEQGEMVATVTLNNKVDKKHEPFRDIKQSAKHEALHLLVGRLQQNGQYRYASASEIYEASEELVRRLEDLIPDINPE